MTLVATDHTTRAEAERRIAAARHVAEIRHAAPGEALITCTCGKLRTVIDVDDRQAVTLVLSQHLRTDAWRRRPSAGRRHPHRGSLFSLPPC
jgi:hypothetical protein